MFDDIEWDVNAVGITAAAEILMLIMMFQEGMGWQNIPLWWKVSVIIIGAPVWYFVALKVMNK